MYCFLVHPPWRAIKSMSAGRNWYIFIWADSSFYKWQKSLQDTKHPKTINVDILHNCFCIDRIGYYSSVKTDKNNFISMVSPCHPIKKPLLYPQTQALAFMYLNFWPKKNRIFNPKTFFSKRVLFLNMIIDRVWR